MRHAFRGKTPGLDRVVIQPDAHGGIGQLTGGDRSLSERTRPGKECGPAGLVLQSEVFGLCQGQWNALLCRCANRP
jgi:hypothetical protein